jgi:hypothetical protein
VQMTWAASRAACAFSLLTRTSAQLRRQVQRVAQRAL